MRYNWTVATGGEKDMLERNVSQRKSKRLTELLPNGDRWERTQTNTTSTDAPHQMLLPLWQCTEVGQRRGKRERHGDEESFAPHTPLEEEPGSALVRKSRLLGEATARTPTTAPKQAAMTEIGTATISLSMRAAV